MGGEEGADEHTRPHLEEFHAYLSLYTKQVLLSKAPKDGSSLSRLQTIGPIGPVLDNSRAVDELRQTLVERGCRKSLRELQIRLPTRAERTHQRVLRDIGQLVDEVVRPDALDNVTVTGDRSAGLIMDIELIGWMSTESPQVQRIVRAYAAAAAKVQYDGGVLTDPNATATTTHFPRAHAFTFTSGPPSQVTLDGLARTVAKMPQCRCISFGGPGGDAPLSRAVSFFEALKGQLATRVVVVGRECSSQWRFHRGSRPS